jgi:hypothetical protein
MDPFGGSLQNVGSCEVILFSRCKPFRALAHIARNFFCAEDQSGEAVSRAEFAISSVADRRCVGQRTEVVHATS